MYHFDLYHYWNGLHAINERLFFLILIGKVLSKTHYVKSSESS